MYFRRAGHLYCVCWVPAVLRAAAHAAAEEVCEPGAGDSGVDGGVVGGELFFLWRLLAVFSRKGFIPFL